MCHRICNFSIFFALETTETSEVNPHKIKLCTKLGRAIVAIKTIYYSLHVCDNDIQTKPFCNMCVSLILPVNRVINHNDMSWIPLKLTFI